MCLSFSSNSEMNQMHKMCVNVEDEQTAKH